MFGVKRRWRNGGAGADGEGDGACLLVLVAEADGAFISRPSVDHDIHTGAVLLYSTQSFLYFYLKTLSTSSLASICVPPGLFHVIGGGVECPRSMNYTQRSVHSD